MKNHLIKMHMKEAEHHNELAKLHTSHHEIAKDAADAHDDDSPTMSFLRHHADFHKSAAAEHVGQAKFHVKCAKALAEGSVVDQIDTDALGVPSKAAAALFTKSALDSATDDLDKALGLIRNSVVPSGAKSVVPDTPKLVARDKMMQEIIDSEEKVGSDLPPTLRKMVDATF